MLPKEPAVPKREIDMSKLQRIKSLGKDESSDPNFQSSNPISLWVDPETNRKFIVKQCPEQTLQADYFGLEMLQLAGVPIYEFYTGWVPGTDGEPPQRVLVSGFLEGFEDPSRLIHLPEGSPPDMMKARFPARFHFNQQIQQGMLVEILIGEYNSKPHNFMVLGDSVQHLDQGACLTSTASGKFKGFAETVTIQDVQDVLQCFPDWDYNATEPVNEAYANVVQVVDGKLIIRDISQAKHLLTQLRSIPQERINQALERAGFEDGPRSVARMQSWIKQIDNEFLPKYQKIFESERKKQYLRWSESAKDTFRRAIAAGGELSYYKQALRTRRTSLENLWKDAIVRAEQRQQ